MRNIRRVYILCFRQRRHSTPIHSLAFAAHVHRKCVVCVVELKLLKQNNDLFVLQRLQPAFLQCVNVSHIRNSNVSRPGNMSLFCWRFLFRYAVCHVLGPPAPPSIVSTQSTIRDPYANGKTCKYPYYFVRCVRVRHFRGNMCVMRHADGNYNVSVSAERLRREPHRARRPNRMFACLKRIGFARVHAASCNGI